MVLNLFGKKSKKPQKEEFLPEFPGEQVGIKEAPLFSETDLSQIRELVAGSRTSTEMSLPTQPPKPPVQNINVPPTPKPIEHTQTQPVHMEEYHPSYEEKEEKPEVYIKIDKYRQVMDTLNKLILKTKELDGILSDLEKIKEEEAKTLDNWRQELEEIKSKINLVLEVLKE